MSAGVDEAYVVARRVLLDALEALAPHLDAVTLVGAQAVYLRVGEADIAVAPATTDGDLAIDPEELADTPPLERLMRGAGFERKRGDHGELLPGIWGRQVATEKGAIFTVDLLVPSAVASAQGRRAARLSGHETGSVLKVEGLESSLVDADVIQVAALEEGDRRAFDVRVAGAAALLVAKVHKISDREKEAGRLRDKDALDVWRLLRGTPTAAMALAYSVLLADSLSAASARAALPGLKDLFARRDGEGIQMAIRATAGLVPADEVAASLVALATDLVEAVG